MAPSVSFRVDKSNVIELSLKNGVFDFHGSKHNNIVWSRLLFECFTPFLDTNPACPPGERHKAVLRFAISARP
jgi:hypothetical protein